MLTLTSVAAHTNAWRINQSAEASVRMYRVDIDAEMFSCAVVILCFRLWWRKEMRKGATWRSALDASWATSPLIYWRRSLWHKNLNTQWTSLQHTLNISTNRRRHCLGDFPDLSATFHICYLKMIVSVTAEMYLLWCICAFDTKRSMRKERLMIDSLKKWFHLCVR